MSVYLDMNRSRSISAATAAQKNNEEVFLVAQKDPAVENPDQSQLERFGVLAYVKQIVKTPNDIVRVLVTGIEAAELIETAEYVPHLVAEIRTLEVKEEEQARQDAMQRILRDEVSRYIQVRKNISRELRVLMETETEYEAFSRQLACGLPLDQLSRQRYLAVSEDDERRYEFLIEWLDHETDVETFRKEYQEKVRHNLDQHQKEYILREQMKVIQDELGDSAETEADAYERQLSELVVPDEVKTQIEKEIRRLRRMNYGGPELGVSQNYIETLLSMPWEARTQETLSIADARQVLDEDHYGLEKVKEQVLEFLAVRKMTQNESGQVLCLVGPPGTGKTSIAQSVARALNRKYVRISLGGVRDEAEIRGHRRTYIGAMPGRIAAGIKRAGVKNPLMLLDEIDKVSGDTLKGDLSSALLEVLDREQNHTFHDNYLEVGLDLSEVLFLATANTLQTIPRPLLDRMEVIEIGSYTEKEKLQIAQRYLLPRQKERCGLPEGLLRVDRSALEQIIRFYTREAGVRGLERRLETICRKAAMEYLEQQKSTIRVTVRNLERYLGRKKYRLQEANQAGDVGIVRGLAWTSVGGDTLQIEVNTAPGKGALVLTGQMGDVMKESAQIALSYVKSVAGAYGVTPEFFEKYDIHLHIPEGAVPKDGPSAGITMATAILSAVSGRPVRPDLAMTGEVTLRGRVLPIGGLKEKLLAAKAAGICQVLVPDQNREDVAELPEEVTEHLEITFVEQMPQVLEQAWEKTGAAGGNYGN